MRRLNQEEKETLMKMYETGNYTFKGLDLHFNIGLGSSRGLLLRRGYIAKSLSEINRKYALDETYFDSIDTEEKAYMLGFIYADGCNFPEGTRVIISLHEKDRIILDKFKILLGYSRPLGYRTSKKSSPQYYLTISSKKISEKMTELGVVKAKSKILTFPKWLNSAMYSPFIRGYFDGDGCITGQKEQKWSVVGTKEFLEKVQEILIKELQIGNPKLRFFRNIYYLEYKGRRQINKIKNWMYKDATIFLERKYNKFL